MPTWPGFTYVVLLMSSDYISEGDYYQAEFYFLMLTSVLGMIAIARVLPREFNATTLPPPPPASWRSTTEPGESAFAIRKREPAPMPR